MPNGNNDGICGIIFIYSLQRFATERYLDFDTDNLKSPCMPTCPCMHAREFLLHIFDLFTLMAIIPHKMALIVI